MLMLNLALELLLPLILSLHPASGWVGGRNVLTFKRSTL
jgi:hypothetical protein